MMKKFFALILTVCMMAAAFCITVFAADPPAADVVLRISALNKSGTAVDIENADYTNFEEGWEAAIDLAEDDDTMENNDYSRIVVDFYADWNANTDGEFGDSDYDGFQFSTIYIPDDVRITLNLNGHTINRGLEKWEYDGEVMYIDEDADVIINDGTIKGGYSCNGAGGIHINDNANVTLNNVHIVGNIVEDDDGAGIAIYDNATLVVNGGSFRDNMTDESDAFVLGSLGGALYAYNSTVMLNGVEFRNNQTRSASGKGAVICSDGGSRVTMDNCIVDGNGIENEEEDWYASTSIIYVSSGIFTVKNTTFTNNGDYAFATQLNQYHMTSLISCANVQLFEMMDDCVIENNATTVIFLDTLGVVMQISDTRIANNASAIYYGHSLSSSRSYFKNCKLINNNPPDDGEKVWYSFNHVLDTLTLYDCELDNVTFESMKNIRIARWNDLGSASIFGEGSFSTVFALIALVSSLASIGICLVSNKKKAASDKH